MSNSICIEDNNSHDSVLHVLSHNVSNTAAWLVALGLNLDAPPAPLALVLHLKGSAAKFGVIFSLQEPVRLSKSKVQTKEQTNVTQRSRNSTYLHLNLLTLKTKCTYCKLLWIKAPAKCPKCKSFNYMRPHRLCNVTWKQISLHIRSHVGPKLQTQQQKLHTVPSNRTGSTIQSSESASSK